MNLFEWLENERKQILTLQDALLTVAICAAKIDADDSHGDINRIAVLAISHPLFSNERDTVEPRVNMLVHLILNTDPVKAIDIAAKSLTPELRETAFEWAAKMAMADGLLSGEKKVLLEKLAMQLLIDIKVAGKILKDTA